MISLSPSTLGEVLADIPQLAGEAEVPEAGEALAEEAAERIEEVELAIAGDPRPRVAALEWPRPPLRGRPGVPQMIGQQAARNVLGAGEVALPSVEDGRRRRPAS